jgi:aerobic carbon-monoxide dehydrogenase medium subunit
VIPPEFEYHRASSVRDAIDALASGGEDARALAGGQSLISLLRLRLARPSLLVDLSGIANLDRVSLSGHGLSVGAMVTHHQVLRELTRLSGHESFADAASQLGDRQIRSRGTLVGALAHADPAGDWLPVAIALRFRVNISGPAGDRTQPAEEFTTSAFTTTLEPGEVVTSVDVPKIRQGETSAYVKVPNPASGYAQAGAAAALVVHEGTLVEASVALTGVAASPSRLPSVENALLGGATAQDASRYCLDDIEAGPATPDRRYRLNLAQVTTRRSINTAVARGARRHGG